MTNTYWKACKKTSKKNAFETGGVGGSKTTQYKIGETYEVSGDPVLCENGFHFYKSSDFVFGLTLFEAETVFVEVKPLSKVISDTGKCVCTKIQIVRYIPKKEWQRLIDKNKNSGNKNSGNWNSGYYNSGNRNSGNWNSGNYNSGYRNSGNWNSGNWNSGDSNSGNYNSGNSNSGNYNSGNSNSGNWNSGDYNSRNYNSGNWNSGNYNSGYRNSGNWNSGNWNSGDSNSGNYNSGDSNSGNWNSGDGYRNYFCTETKYFLFDIEVEKSVIEKVQSINMAWFNLEEVSYKEAWSKCPKEVLKEFSKIAEFQTASAREKFTVITGLTLKERLK